MEYQNLDWAIPIIKQQLKESPHSKISTIFLLLRKHPRLSLFGDYSIYAIAIEQLRKSKRSIAKEDIRKALQVSKELRRKETIMDALFTG